MSVYQAAIFDLDGTLLDTLDDLTDACNHAMKAFSFAEHTREEVCDFVGNGVGLLIRRALPVGTEEDTIQAVLEEFKRFYAAHNQVKTCPYPGIPEMLEKLCQSGIRCGLVSNKNDPNVKALAQAYFNTMITEVVGEREGIRKKPAPDSVLTILKHWGIPPEKAVYIGDSDVDVETARNVGCDCAAVCWGFRSRESLLAAGAIHLFETPEELTLFLLREREEEP